MLPESVFLPHPQGIVIHSRTRIHCRDSGFFKIKKA